MQCEVAARGKITVDGDQLLHATHFRREDDAVFRQAEFDRAFGGVERGAHQRLAQHAGRIPRLGAPGVLVHQHGGEGLVERAPVGTDAHGLAVLQRLLDDGRELSVLLLAKTDIAWVDAVLRQRLGAGRMLAQQLVPVVVEVADDRHLDAHHRQPVADMRHRGGGFLVVDGNAHLLGTRTPQLGDLLGAALDVGGVGIGHRLHDDRRVTADRHFADANRDRTATRRRGNGAHRSIQVSGTGTGA